MPAEKEKKEYTRFEKARMIGARALQISRGAPPLIDCKDPDPVKIAEAELEAGVIPLDVKRKMPPRLESS
ncbi:MAG: DNA-directed RNA polymerase subunit K [Candidatus Aenigmatarchaeota archaeon]